MKHCAVVRVTMFDTFFTFVCAGVADVGDKDDVGDCRPIVDVSFFC